MKSNKDLRLSFCYFFLFFASISCKESTTETTSIRNEVVVPESPVIIENTPRLISKLEQAMIDAGLRNIQDFDSTLLVDLKYSTTDNFMNADVYGDLEKCYLRPLAAEKLARAQSILKKIHPNYSLLIYDGTRPRRVQYIMWDTVKIPNKINYVANPHVGSIHNYGMAVDLSIADENGITLDMGTAFDFFGELAQPQLESKYIGNGLSQNQIDNRDLLRRVMREAGFFGIKTEWWHFLALLSKEVKANYEMIE